MGETTYCHISFCADVDSFFHGSAPGGCFQIKPGGYYKGTLYQQGQTCHEVRWQMLFE